jgi:hypothetical protein
MLTVVDFKRSCTGSSPRIFIWSSSGNCMIMLEVSEMKKKGENRHEYD